MDRQQKVELLKKVQSGKMPLKAILGALTLDLSKLNIDELKQLFRIIKERETQGKETLSKEDQAFISSLKNKVTYK